MGCVPAGLLCLRTLGNNWVLLVLGCMGGSSWGVLSTESKTDSGWNAALSEVSGVWDVPGIRHSHTMLGFPVPVVYALWELCGLAF